MPSHRALSISLALLLVSSAAGAQQAPTSCESRQPPIARRCAAAIQTAFSAPPQIGILLAGGDPAPAARGGRAWLGGRVPGLTAGVSLRAATYGAPDLTDQFGGEVDVPTRNEQRSLQPVLVADVAWSALPLGGLASVDLLGSAAMLQHEIIGGAVFERESAAFAWGAGARLSTRAGVAASLMYRAVGDMAIGDVCMVKETPSSVVGGFPGAAVTACVDPEYTDAGEVRFDVAALSGRLVASRAFGAVGISAGVGMDRFTSSDVTVASRGVVVNDSTYLVNRFGPFQVQDERLSGFVGATYALPEGTVALEVGYVGGGEAVGAYPADAAYDPRKATVFGTLGFRFAL